MIEILRLSHRISRDKRLTSHIGLTCRAFLVDKMFYGGEHDSSMEESVKDVVKRFGGKFFIEYVTHPGSFVRDRKKKGYCVVHLTAYGLGVKKQLGKIKKEKNVLIIIGSEQVPPEYFRLANFNISITSQPISELSALAVFLHEILEGKELGFDFSGAKMKIIPKEKGKQLDEV